MVLHLQIRADILFTSRLFLRPYGSGFGKILCNLQNICTHYMLINRIRCVYTACGFLGISWVSPTGYVINIYLVKLTIDDSECFNPPSLLPPTRTHEVFPLVPLSSISSILANVLHYRCKVKSYFFVQFTQQISRGLDIFLAIYNVLL